MEDDKIFCRHCGKLLLTNEQIDTMNDVVTSLQVLFDHECVLDMTIRFFDCSTHCTLIIEGHKPRELRNAEVEWQYDNRCYVDFHHESTCQQEEELPEG